MASFSGADATANFVCDHILSLLKDLVLPAWGLWDKWGGVYFPKHTYFRWFNIMLPCRDSRPAVGKLFSQVCAMQDVLKGCEESLGITKPGKVQQLCSIPATICFRFLQHSTTLAEVSLSHTPALAAVPGFVLRHRGKIFCGQDEHKGLHADWFNYYNTNPSLKIPAGCVCSAMKHS